MIINESTITRTIQGLAKAVFLELTEAGLTRAAQEANRRILECSSYRAAKTIARNYVEIVRF